MPLSQKSKSSMELQKQPMVLKMVLSLVLNFCHSQALFMEVPSLCQKNSFSSISIRAAQHSCDCNYSYLQWSLAHIWKMRVTQQQIEVQRSNLVITVHLCPYDHHRHYCYGQYSKTCQGLWGQPATGIERTFCSYLLNTIKSSNVIEVWAWIFKWSPPSCQPADFE